MNSVDKSPDSGYSRKAYKTDTPMDMSKHFRAAGGVSGALYLQSATAGVILIRGSFTARQPSISGVDAWVLRNRNL